jgi:hypothetical protein
MSFPRIGIITPPEDRCFGGVVHTEDVNGKPVAADYTIPAGVARPWIEDDDLTWYNIGQFGALRQLSVQYHWFSSAGNSTASMTYKYAMAEDHISDSIRAPFMSGVTVSVSPGVTSCYTVNDRSEIHTTAGTTSIALPALGAAWIAFGGSATVNSIASLQITWHAELVKSRVAQVSVSEIV